ncbi:MAG: TIM barrel protein [Rhodobacter sp.]|nr:TIM barrel protein [Paracoccaceae bacterium]MCC0076807.1 TIM barrel protein [Rhodobacter sp.]
MRFSANLGFLWTDRPLPEAIRAAAHAGFDAVECHWPYETPPADMRAALADTGLPMLSLNTRPGDSFGLAALPGPAGRAAIDEGLDYAAAIGAGAVHVMAGTGGSLGIFADNLHHACTRAAPLGLTVLIEPLNPRDAPGYTLGTLDQAAALIEALNHPALKILFDCYHIARIDGPAAVAPRFDALRAQIGHVQFAAVPDRGAPDHGDLDYAALLPSLDWTGPFGAEYRPAGPTDDSLAWLKTLRP